MLDPAAFLERKENDKS